MPSDDWVRLDANAMFYVLFRDNLIKFNYDFNVLGAYMLSIQAFDTL